jgi:hypothetical protein
LIKDKFAVVGGTFLYDDKSAEFIRRKGELVLSLPGLKILGIARRRVGRRMMRMVRMVRMMRMVVVMVVMMRVMRPFQIITNRVGGEIISIHIHHGRVEIIVVAVVVAMVVAVVIVVVVAVAVIIIAVAVVLDIMIITPFPLLTGIAKDAEDGVEDEPGQEEADEDAQEPKPMMMVAVVVGVGGARLGFIRFTGMTTLPPARTSPLAALALALMFFIDGLGIRLSLGVSLEKASLFRILYGNRSVFSWGPRHLFLGERVSKIFRGRLEGE